MANGVVTVPPAGHAAVLAVAAAVVGWALYRERPRVREETVLALSPWVLAGGSLYAAYQLDRFPASVAPLFSSPAVYVTAAVLAGAVWLLARHTPNPLWVLGATGGLATAIPVGVVARAAMQRGSFDPWVVATGAAVALGLAALTWVALQRFAPDAVAVAGTTGGLAVLGHALDGASTAIGIRRGFGEQTPTSRLLIEATAGLPRPPFVGKAWAFVLVKLLLAAAVVWLLAPTVREREAEGRLLLGFVAAVGLGPGTHNLVLFAATFPLSG